MEKDPGAQQIANRKTHTDSCAPGEEHCRREGQRPQSVKQEIATNIPPEDKINFIAHHYIIQKSTNNRFSQKKKKTIVDGSVTAILLPQFVLP